METEKLLKEPLSVTEWIEKNAATTSRAVERIHAKKGEVCAMCLMTISKEDFAAGRYVFTESKASGKSYICYRCAGL